MYTILYHRWRLQCVIFYTVLKSSQNSDELTNDFTNGWCNPTWCKLYWYCLSAIKSAILINVDNHLSTISLLLLCLLRVTWFSLSLTKNYISRTSALSDSALCIQGPLSVSYWFIRPLALMHHRSPKSYYWHAINCH